MGFALIRSLAPGSAQAETAGSAAGETAVERLRQLMLKPDKTELEALMSPDLTYGHFDRRVMTRAEVIDS